MSGFCIKNDFIWVKLSGNCGGDVASAKKMKTITCINGKLIKKVTSIKPVCPSGYKKK